jgi:replicative DNA helicase
VRDRQAAILSRAPIGAIKRPHKGLEYDRIVDGVERAKTLRWFVSDKSGLNIMQVRSKARALKRRQSLDVLMVDYIGLMSGMDSKQPRAYQIEEISRGLKGLAKDLDIVVVCLAQVNRGGVERVGQVPGLQDLRDSGAIEQDADVVAFIHRPIEAQPELGENFRNYALLRVAKNRQGRTGDVNLFYHGQYTSFESWSGPAPQKGIGSQSKGFE